MATEDQPVHPPKEQKLKDDTAPEAPHKESQPNKFVAFLQTKKGRIVGAIAAVVVVLGVLFAIPTTRYAIAGTVIKKDLSLQAIDSKTNKPVSAAQLTVAGQTVKTDASGKVTVHNVSVGPWHVVATKANYQNTQIDGTLPIFNTPATAQITMTATGRQVPVTVTNKLTHKPVANVEISAGDATATTASDGTATVVLPANKDKVSANFKASGYNTTTADITVTEQQDTANGFTVTPSGKVYFLSKRTGKINVMSSDLDGVHQDVVVTGTGKESDTDTVLLASRDWKYLALQAIRDDTGKPKLYLVDTASGKLSTIDEGDNVSFSPVGWSNERFIYRVTRINVGAWQPKRQSIKSFNATNGQIATLDDTDAVGTASNAFSGEQYSAVYIIGNTITYAKYWLGYYPELLTDKKSAIYSVNADGTNKQTLSAFTAATHNNIQSQLYEPSEVYYRDAGSFSGPVQFYAFKDGKVNPTTEATDDNFYQNYNTYLVSPSGKLTLWSESRDGKNVIQIGDSDGANGKELTTDGTFSTYGWFTDNYILLSKNGSELYIMPSDPNAKVPPLKITDYHKPATTFPGYGYGYGGGN